MDRARRLPAIVFVLLTVCALAGCAQEGDDGQGTTLEAAPPPVLGPADSLDAADRECRVVLRRAAQAVLADGRPEQRCSGRDCWRVIEVEVDVDPGLLEDDAQVHVLYSPDRAAGWYSVAAERIEEAGAEGYVRVRARLVEQTVPAEAELAAGAALELIPYVKTRIGARLFDHNRNVEPLDNYLLSSAGGFAVDDSVTACSEAPQSGPEADGEVRFAADGGAPVVEGVIVPGGTVAVHYALERLDACLGTSGQDMLVRASFADDSEPVYDSVMSCGDAACSEPTSRPVVLELPRTAGALELSFEATGEGCSAADEGHRLELTPGPQWLGDFFFNATRSYQGQCTGGDGSVLGDGSSAVRFDSWTRHRAAITNLCFQLWQPGVTDFANLEIERAFKVELECRWGEAVTQHEAAFDAFAGNNARYRLDLRGLDPFAPFHCPQAGVSTTVEGDTVRAEASCQALANGAPWGVEGADGALRLVFEDYAGNTWRAENCR